MISNSGHDEKNKFYGGDAGDQTGGEWSIINWYSRPWDLVLRHPDERVRKEIALLARQAANNNKIGYDQYQRHTYWEALEKFNYDPSKITTTCEADCSSDVLANIKAVGYRLNIDKLKNVDHTGYTGNMRRILFSAGFTILSSSTYLKSDDYLLEGDILLNELKHTATNLTDGKKVNKRDKSKNVSEGQAWLNSNYGNLITKYTMKKLEVDNIYGRHSRQAALIVWKYMMNKYHYRVHLNLLDNVFDAECKAAASVGVVKYGSNGTLAYLIQFILSAKGFYTGKMDAIFGNDTKKAVKNFQNANGLVVDGLVGENTWSLLFRE